MNGTKQNGAAPKGGLGNEYTDQVVNSMGPKTDGRLKEVMASFIHHIHDFARDVDLTFNEWMAGVQLVG